MNKKEILHIKTKRIIAYAMMGIGFVIIAGSLLWIIAYHIESYLNDKSYSFTFNLGWWLPVSLFLFPGIMFLAQGKKIYKSEPLAPIALIELIIVLAILGFISAVAFPPADHSYVERVNKLEEQNNSQMIEENNGNKNHAT